MNQKEPKPPEVLLTCPVCGQGGFLPQGLRAHAGRKACSKRVAAAAAAKAEPITWIPCEQRKPDDELTVLVFNKDWVDPVWLGFPDAGVWRWVDASTAEPPPTHWAEMPKGPHYENT